MDYQIQPSILKAKGNNVGINWSKLQNKPEVIFGSSYIPNNVFYGQFQYYLENDGVYHLNIPNSRQSFNISSGFIYALNVVNELIIDARGIKFLTLKPFDTIYDVSQKPYSSRFVSIPTKKMTIKADQQIFIAMPALSSLRNIEKHSGQSNDSKLEELALEASAFNTRIFSFPKLEKISYKQPTNPEPYSQVISFRNCPNLKEIDLSGLSVYKYYVNFSLENISDDCLIKINPELFKSISFINSFKNDKKSFSISFQETQMTPSEYWPMSYSELLDISPELKKYESMSNPITITVKQLKNFFAYIHKLDKNKKIIDKNKKRQQIQKIIWSI